MLLGALGSATIALTLGVLIGTCAAFYKGIIGSLCKAPIDILASIPRYILIVLLFSMYEKGFVYLILGVGIASVPTSAESIRNHISEQLAQGRYRAFIAHGLSPFRILGFHFLWIAGRRVLARDFLTVTTLFLITETSISYIDPYVYLNFSATWGMMLSRLLHGQHLTNPMTWVVIGWFAVALFCIAALRRQVGANR